MFKKLSWQGANMTEKKFITILLISLSIIGSLIYLGERGNYNPENQRVEFAYTFASNDEVTSYMEKDVDNFNWVKVPFGTTKLSYGEERFTILRVSLDEKLNNEKALYFRLKNKIYELYIDGVLIKRNGDVGAGNFFSTVTTYSEFKIPLDEEYQGKDVVILIESATKYEVVNLESAEVISTVDFFNSYSLFDVITAFFLIIAMVISGLAALNVYWMRFSFGGKLYLVIIPTWFLIGGFILDTPYIYFNYFIGTEICAMLGTILLVVGLLIVLYGIRGSARNRTLKNIVGGVLTTTWVFAFTIILLNLMGEINWSFAQYLSAKLSITLSLPIFAYCYIHANYVDKIFVRPFKIYFATMSLVCIMCYGLYNISPYFTSVLAVNYAIIYSVIAMMILSSYIINTFHTNLFIELMDVSQENDIYKHIELSRQSVKKADEVGENGEYSNFSIGYVESILQSEMNATSLIIKEEQNEEIEVIYVASSFGKVKLTLEETRYYLSIYNNIFEGKNHNAIQIGKTLYLGFKQHNLCYFMIINSKETVGELKLKALTTYATGIKNNAQNYVITRYVEIARNDVIKSFGKTIESRVASSNIIGITDKFVVFIARSLGKPENEVQTLKTASYIKNIGSIIMSESDLTDYKNMTPEQLENAYRRADYGFEILKKFDDTILSKAAIMAYYQFESYDGSGHLGIKGERIPDEGKIIKLAVCMTSALRYNIDLDNLFAEVMDYVETNHKRVVSPYLVNKCKENYAIFDEIVFRNKEEFYELARKAALLDPENYIC